MPNKRSARVLAPHLVQRHLCRYGFLQLGCSKVAAALAAVAVSTLAFVAPSAPPSRTTTSVVQMQVGTDKSTHGDRLAPVDCRQVASTQASFQICSVLPARAGPPVRLLMQR